MFGSDDVRGPRLEVRAGEPLADRLAALGSAAGLLGVRLLGAGLLDGGTIQACRSGPVEDEAAAAGSKRTGSSGGGLAQLAIARTTASARSERRQGRFIERQPTGSGGFDTRLTPSLLFVFEH
jgi:hypothetical protein